MKIKFIALVTVLVIVAAIGLSWQRLSFREAENQIGLVVEPRNQDLGRVKYGDTPSTDFEVRNLGGETIQITQISTSCGCTTATLVGHEDQLTEGESVSIAGGEVKTMQVTFNPAVHGDDTDLGPLKRVIYAGTDNPQQPELQVTITADVYK